MFNLKHSLESWNYYKSGLFMVLLTFITVKLLPQTPSVEKLIQIVHIPILIFIAIIARKIWQRHVTIEEEKESVTQLRHSIYGMIRRSNRFIESSVNELLAFKKYFSRIWIFLLLYYLAQVITSSLKPEIQANMSFSYAIYFLGLNFIPFLLDMMGTLFLFWCFLILYLPAHTPEEQIKQQVLRRHSIFALALISSLYWLVAVYFCATNEELGQYIKGIATAFEAVEDILTAVAVALLVARMDSKLIGLPSSLIGIVYFYSAVQPLFITTWGPHDVYETLSTISYASVLFLKILLFLIVLYIMQTGRVLHYLLSYPILDWRVDSVFDNQFEIKIRREDELYHFQISNHNELVYFTDENDEERELCRKRIVRLRQSVADREVEYKIKNSCSTHWVELWHATSKELLCFSTNLKSEKDAKELIRQSKNKLPYCKVDFV